MKKVALLTFILLVSFLNFAIEFTSKAQTASELLLPADMPKTINLLEITPLYPEPDDTLQPRASLSPQEVNVVFIQPGNHDHAYPADHTWIQIRTSWLGDMWIKIESRKMGIIRPFHADLNLEVNAPLYDKPYREAANGGILSPQTVHAKAEFISPSGFSAIQIETSWLGDQWLIQPEIKNEQSEILSFPDAISPNYGDLMMIKGIRVINIGERAFIQGQLVLQKEAWNVGRANPKSSEYYVSGTLSFWDQSGGIIAQIPYTVYTHAGESINTSLLLPVETTLSSAVLATLQDTFPRYFGLPSPPLLNLKDIDDRVLLGFLHISETEDYTAAQAWISGRLPGIHEYELTLTFLDENNHILGYAHVHQKLNGPPTPDQASPEGGGNIDLIDIVGSGNWANYHHAEIKVDRVSAAASA